MRFIDLTGERFGSLIVLERYYHPDQRTRTFWRCLCDCGAIHFAASVHLKDGSVTSCGCRRSLLLASGVLSSTHRMTNTREHRSWTAMKNRCYNPNAENYGHYGGRGIRVCDRWRRSFPTFLVDMGLAPSAVHTLDRIDNDGDYCPENCRWATKSDQMRNTRANRRFTYAGETLPVAVWGERTGLPPAVITRRILEYNWSVADAIETPLGQRRTQHKP